MRMGFFLENIWTDMQAWRDREVAKVEFFKSLDVAEKMGIKNFQMFMGRTLISLDMPKDEMKAIKSALDERGMKIVAFAQSHGHMGFYFPEEYKEELETYKREIEFAKEFGVSMFGGHLGKVVEDKTSPLYKTYLKTYKDIADFAASVDSCFAMETGPDEVVPLKEFLDEVDSKGAGVNYDTANIVRILNQDAAYGIRVLDKHIKLFHAKDGTCIQKSNSDAVYIHDVLGIERQKAKGFYDEKPIGQGQVKWPEAIKALKEIKYDGDIIIEREAGINTVQEILDGKALVENLLNTNY